MHNEMTSAIEAEAADWVMRQHDSEFADWDAFTSWLAQSDEHVAAYDKVASLDRDLEALPRQPAIAAPAPRRFAVTRRAWMGGAIAAALVGVVSYSMIGNGNTRIETIAGEHRTIALADGSRIEINGASVVELDKDRPRFARLEQGEAMFHVVHHEGDPFMVEAGDAKLVDLGTAFNVVRRNDETSVAVSEGVVAYNPDSDNVRIDAGKAIAARDGAGRPQVQDIDVHNIGGWRNGQLVYNGTSLAQVAEDLGRTSGMKVAVADDVASLPFRGALLVGEDRNRVIADLTALAGVRARKESDGWLLTR